MVYAVCVSAATGRRKDRPFGGATRPYNLNGCLRTLDPPTNSHITCIVKGMVPSLLRATRITQSLRIASNQQIDEKCVFGCYCLMSMSMAPDHCCISSTPMSTSIY